MIDLADLGIAAETRPDHPAADPEPSTQPTFTYDEGLEPGTPGARALWHTWRGDPIVIIDSPPGAGKTTLVSRIVTRLVQESDLRIVVASPTVRGAEALAERIALCMDEDHEVVLSGSSFRRTDYGDGVQVASSVKRHAIVRTVSSCRMSPPQADILVVDEAYQVTFADLVSAAAQADQVLMVGDPGQIGPVTTVDVSPWGGMEVSPADRAPEGFALRPDALRLNLDKTYRLGEETVEAIAPLYDFEFASARRDTWVGDLPEIEDLRLPVTDKPADPDAMRMVAKRAASFIGMEALFPDGTERPVRQRDVAVVAARNEQVAMLTAMMRSLDLPGVTVGTADSLQGGQWQAVVAVDPLIGSDTASDHSLSLGRLCVMASRHVGHLTWAASPDYGDVIGSAVPDPEVAAVHGAVRYRLLGW